MFFLYFHLFLYLNSSTVLEQCPDIGKALKFCFEIFKVDKGRYSRYHDRCGAFKKLVRNFENSKYDNSSGLKFLVPNEKEHISSVASVQL